MKQNKKAVDPLPDFPDIEVEFDDSGTTLNYRPRLVARILAGAFLTVWLSFWTFICLALAAGLLFDFSWFTLLFALPFFAGWFFGAWMFIYMMTVRQVLHIGHQWVEVTNSIVLWTTLKKRIRRQDILEVRKHLNDETYKCVLETTSGVIALCISTSNESEIERAMDFLRFQFESLSIGQPHSQSGFQLAKQPATNSASEKSETPQPGFQFRRTEQRPETCDWQDETGFAGKTVFSKTGKFKFTESLAILGACIFWNGIVGSFLLSPWSESAKANPRSYVELTFIYLFLTPFIIFGLVLIVMTLASFFASFSQTTYAFSNRQIERTKQFFGIPFSKTWPVMGVLQIELMHEQQKREKQFFKPEGIETKPKQFSLEFHLPDQKLLSLGELTYDEASWIGTRLVDQLRNFESTELGPGS